MATIKKWVCNTCPEHVFDEPSEDGFCPYDPPWHGKLILRTIDPEPLPGIKIRLLSPADRSAFSERERVPMTADASVDRGNITRVDFLVGGRKVGESSGPPYSFSWPADRQGSYELTAVAWDGQGGSKTSDAVRIAVRSDSAREIGLCVLLMDASASMTDPISDADPKTKMQQVAESAATGIFDLQRLQNNQDAWVTAFKFDDRVEKMFEESVAELIRRYDKDVKKFAAYIYDELFKMQQGTDINAALRTAYNYVDGFLQKKGDFPVRNYIPMYQPIMRGVSASSISIPNIRVLMYTDGMQFDTHKDRHLRPNPFLKPPAGLNHDILIGAFFGRASDAGCTELKNLVSNCPIHEDTEQFFLFDTPKKLENMKHLFRMASGASGFCPLCLGKELRR